MDREFWPGRRVLVTGHTGFKGAWLSLWLQSLGAHVSGIAPGAVGSPSLYELARVGREMTSARVDVRDHQALASTFAGERPEVVFHLAAQPLVRRSFRDPRTTYEINVMGTVNVLEAVRATPGVRAVVVVTSDKCYENRDGASRPFVEGDPMGGQDPYSSSKGAAELVTAAYRDSFFSGSDSPTRVGSARAGNVIGGGDWGEDRLIPDFIRAAEQGSTIRVRNPDAIRPWQHVLNPLSGYLMLAQALCSAADPVGAAEGWNFGPDAADARPVRWIADRLAELWPGGLRWELDLAAARQPHEAARLTLDSSKAGERLGWRPRWALDEALARVVEWHSAQRDGADMRELTLAQIDAYPG